MKKRIILIMIFSLLVIVGAGLCIAIGKEKVMKDSTISSGLKVAKTNIPERKNLQRAVDPTNLIVDKITKLPVRNGDEPSFSPDGSKIVFVKEWGGDDGIWVVNVDGTDEHCIFEGKDVGVYSPCWSPDGTKILFCGGGTSTSYGDDIWIMDANGDNRVKLTSYGSEERESIVDQARWSPDGKRIVYVYVAGDEWEEAGIYTMNINGTDTKQIIDKNLSGSVTLSYTPYEAITYSPDGTKIAVVALTDTNHDKILESWIGKDTYQLWVMDADGKNRKQLTDLPIELIDEAIPLWFPDSKHILLNDIDGVINIESGTITTLEGLYVEGLTYYTDEELNEEDYGSRSVSAISNDGLILAGGNLDYPRQGNPYLYVITLKEKVVSKKN